MKKWMISIFMSLLFATNISLSAATFNNRIVVFIGMIIPIYVMMTGIDELEEKMICRKHLKRQINKITKKVG